MDNSLAIRNPELAKQWPETNIQKYGGSARRDTNGKPKFVIVQEVMAVLIAQGKIS
ncbi:hypothetical protein M2E15_5629 [Bacillus mycoides]|nr:hypothetical protein [Bacillus mycoides]KUH40834.1 hypothetical protein M2E15_5629 [Bacillus mycoides]